MTEINYTNSTKKTKELQLQNTTAINAEKADATNAERTQSDRKPRYDTGKWLGCVMEVCKGFCYLRSTISSDGRCEKGIIIISGARRSMRIAHAE